MKYSPLRRWLTALWLDFPRMNSSLGTCKFLVSQALACEIRGSLKGLVTEIFSNIVIFWSETKESAPGGQHPYHSKLPSSIEERPSETREFLGPLVAQRWWSWREKRPDEF